MILLGVRTMRLSRNVRGDMNQSITIKVPEEILRRYRHGAGAAHQDLERFMVERLREGAPPIPDDLPAPLREELEALEDQNDKELLRIAQGRLPIAKQRLYSRLLRKNGRGAISSGEQATLHRLGNEARRLTLLKSHAYLLLKWRGHSVPPVDSLQAT